MPSLEHWCKAMEGGSRRDHLRGQICLSNMRFDCHHRRVSPAVFRQFHEAVATAWNRRADLHTLPEDVLNQVVSDDPAAYLCQGPSVPNLPGETRKCSRVMPLDDVLKYNVDGNRIPRRRANQMTQQRLERVLQQIPSAAKNEMRGGKAFAWVTPTKELASLRSTYGKRDQGAAVVRLLGLEHFRYREHLVEVLYPAGEPVELHAPTFLDAGANFIYRSDAEPTDNPDGWGRAVDLRTSGPGLPEAIHPALPFTAAFRVMDIGPAELRHAPKWAKIHQKAKHRWEFDGFAELDQYAEG